ncbi:MAG: hypothetical protein CL461_02410 [Acidimicrobiaceae bacterium]|nr:hypothetical protein [Acidimicrobiaceae bacterium]|tara:strand:- start:190 stop:549 length:360 start_codon:yes stop_codon:yes gene_type:complete
MIRIVGIYNADGSILGELNFAIGKVTGKSDCGLCDLTHGWNPFGKPSWRNACSASTIDIELVHRDELTSVQNEVAGDLPAVIALLDGTWRKLMSGEEISSFKGNSSGFLAEIERLVRES